MRNTSTKYSLNSIDVWKTLRGFFVIMLGAIISYVSSVYLNFDYKVVILDNVVDFTVPATAIIASLIELGRRYIADNK